MNDRIIIERKGEWFFERWEEDIQTKIIFKKKLVELKIECFNGILVINVSREDVLPFCGLWESEGGYLGLGGTPGVTVQSYGP